MLKQEVRALAQAAWKLLSADSGQIIGVQTVNFLLNHFFMPPLDGNAGMQRVLDVVLLSFIQMLNFAVVIYRLDCACRNQMQPLSAAYQNALQRWPAFFGLNLLGLGAMMILATPFLLLGAVLHKFVPQSLFVPLASCEVLLFAFLCYLPLPVAWALLVLCRGQQPAKAMSYTLNLLRTKIPKSRLAVLSAAYCVPVLIPMVLPVSQWAWIMLFFSWWALGCHAAAVHTFHHATKQLQRQTQDTTFVLIV